MTTATIHETSPRAADPFDLEDEVVDWQDDNCGWDGEDDDDDF